MPIDTCNNSMYWSHNASITLLFQQFNSAEKAVIKYVTVVRIISNPHHIVVRTISNPHHDVVRISTSYKYYMCKRCRFHIVMNGLEMIFIANMNGCQRETVKRYHEKVWMNERLLKICLVKKLRWKVTLKNCCWPLSSRCSPAVFSLSSPFSHHD